MTVRDLPDWVLRPPSGGFFPDDPVRRAARWMEFRAWQGARRAWLAEHAAHFGFRELEAERRRRFLAVEK